MGKYTILNDDQRRELESYAYGDYFKGTLGARRKKRIFDALEEGRRGLKKVKVSDDDGQAIAALAGAYAASMGLIDWLEKKNSEELKNPGRRRKALELFGGYAAEVYFRDRKIVVADEPSLLAMTVSKNEIAALFAAMVDAGLAAGDELIEPPKAAEIKQAVNLLVDALSNYGDAIPPVDEDGSVPERVQDVGIAKAAFMGLKAEALKELSDGDDDIEATTKQQVAARLAEEYAGREQDIADLVRGAMSGTDEAVRLVSRLLPLSAPPDNLDDSARRLGQLRLSRSPWNFAGAVRDQ